MRKIVIQSGWVWENYTIFAKKHSSHERRLLNLSYICGVVDNLRQT